jgi:quercetin dioxygenase-like cupin family protein
MADRGGRARTIPLVTRATGSPQLLNGITIFDGGAAIGEHLQDREETVMVLEGDAIAELGGVEHGVTAGDTSWIPSGVPRYFRDASATAPMRIF